MRIPRIEDRIFRLRYFIRGSQNLEGAHCHDPRMVVYSWHSSFSRIHELIPTIYRGLFMDYNIHHESTTYEEQEEQLVRMD